MPSEAVNTPGAATRLRRPVLALATMAALAITFNLVLRHTALWYWFPVQYPDAARIYSFAVDPTPYDVVVIGSSVSHRGLISRVMEEELDRLMPRNRPWSAYNLGMRGGTLPAYIEVARNLLPLRPRPRLVVLMFTTFNFNSLADNRDDAKLFTSEPEDFLTLLRHSRQERARWSALSAMLHGPQVLLQAYQIPGDRKHMKKYAEMRGSAFSYPFDAEAREKNARLLPTDRMKARDEKLVEMRDRWFSRGAELSAITEIWMRRLTRSLREQEISFIVLLAPEAEWFVKNLYTDERVNADRFLRKLSAEEGWTYYDLSAPPFHFRDDEFSDLCNHLGPEGAEKLSRDLVRLVIVPELGAREP
mgnify:CR=1 FL=1